MYTDKKIKTDGIRFLARAAQSLQTEYPLIHFHIVSGDSVSVTEDLERGLLDFGLLLGKIDSSKYNSLEVPFTDSFGVLMRRDDPLADKELIQPQDLWEKPLIVSRQSIKDNSLLRLLHCSAEKINIVATYNLLFNGSIMVEEGMGYAICFDHIINVSGDSRLCYRPLADSFDFHMHIVWKKYQVLTKAANKFLQAIQNTI